METVFEGFKINSRRRASGSTGFEPFEGFGLLHELLHEKARRSTSCANSESANCSSAAPGVRRTEPAWT